jgi:hypothetical protein
MMLAGHDEVLGKPVYSVRGASPSLLQQDITRDPNP